MKVFLINHENHIAAETREDAIEFYSIKCECEVTSAEEISLQHKIWHSFYIASPILKKLLNENDNESFEMKRDTEEFCDIVILLSFERIIRIEKITRPYIF